MVYNEAAAATAGFGIIGLMLVGSIISLACFAWALIDMSKRKDLDSGGKLIWALIVFLFGLLGVLVYYFGSGRNN